MTVHAVCLTTLHNRHTPALSARVASVIIRSVVSMPACKRSLVSGNRKYFLQNGHMEYVTDRKQEIFAQNYEISTWNAKPR